MAKESVMNFYERAASLLEQDVGTPSGGDSPAERARKQKEKEGGGAIMQKPPPGHSAADKAKAQRDKERGITASNKPGGKKKKDNGDVDEWGSADAVAQKDKRQADRKEKTGQTTVPHKHGRSNQGGVKFSDKAKAKYSPEAKDKQQAKDDAALNASRKSKVKESFYERAEKLLMEFGSAGPGGSGFRSGKPLTTKAQDDAAKGKDWKKIRQASSGSIEKSGGSKADVQKAKEREAGEKSGNGNGNGGGWSDAARDAAAKARGAKTNGDDGDDEPSVNASKKSRLKRKVKEDDSPSTTVTWQQPKKPTTKDRNKYPKSKKKSKKEESVESPISVMSQLLNEMAESTSKKSKKKVDDDAVDTTLDQEKTDSYKDDAEDEEEGETGQAVEAKKKDKKWIQKAVDPDHEGYCTPMTKATCTPKRKALAKTFKKMGKKRDRETKAKDEK